MVLAGAGAFVPLKFFGYLGNNEINVWGGHQNLNREVLTEFTSQGCDFSKELNHPTWVESFYICKGKDDVAKFYFLGQQDLPQEVISMNYLKEGANAYLFLSLRGNQKAKYNVASGSAWEHFKEVTPESQCKVVTSSSLQKKLECKFHDGTIYQDFLHLSHYLSK